MKRARGKLTGNFYGYLFMAPWILGFLIFTFFPLVYTAYLSFMDVKYSVLGFEMTFAGLNNYVTALVKNTSFVPALLQFILMLAVYTPVIVVVSFILALALNTGIRMRGFFRTIYFLPAIVLSGPVFVQLTETGGAKGFSLSGVFLFDMIAVYSRPLADAFSFVFENFILVLWLTGIPIVLFISGLQKINRSLYEAARIDGATAWQILWKIVLPLTKAIAQVAALFTIVQLGQFSVNPVFAIIKAAVKETTVGLGFAATYSWVYSVVVMLFIAWVFYILRDRGIYNDQRRRRGHA
jgi:ABC-type sugar transport system permease subunit